MEMGHDLCTWCPRPPAEGGVSSEGQRRAAQRPRPPLCPHPCQALTSALLGKCPIAGPTFLRGIAGGLCSHSITSVEAALPGSHDKGPGGTNSQEGL